MLNTPTTPTAKLSPMPDQEQMAKLQKKVYSANRRAKRWAKRCKRLRASRDQASAALETSIMQTWNGAKDATVLISVQALAAAAAQRRCAKCHSSLATGKIVSKGLATSVSSTCACGQNDEWELAPQQTATGAYAVNAGYAGAATFAGIAKPQLDDALSMVGISKVPAASQMYVQQERARTIIVDEAAASCARAMDAVIEHLKAKNISTVPVAFDASWTHRREAGEATAELIALVELSDGRRNVIIAEHAVWKEREQKGEIVRQGNHTATSSQMEHALLIVLLNMVRGRLIEEGLRVDVVVDGDLSTNATLVRDSLIASVHVDLAHRKKRIPKFFDKLPMTHPAKFFGQVVQQLFSSYAFSAAAAGRTEADLREYLREGVVRHLCHDHSRCWEALCIHVRGDQQLELQQPNMLQMSGRTRRDVSKAIVDALETPAHQQLVTAYRTSTSESFHHEKQRRCSKTTDYWKSFRERTLFGLISHNEGPRAAHDCAKKVAGWSGESDAFVAKRMERREKQAQRNRATITARNEERERRRTEQLTSHEAVDLVAYGQIDCERNLSRAANQEVGPREASPRLPSFWTNASSAICAQCKVVDCEDGQTLCVMCIDWHASAE